MNTNSAAPSNDNKNSSVTVIIVQLVPPNDGKGKFALAMGLVSTLISVAGPSVVGWLSR